ncbi:MAG TPA: hypothetical protein HA311_09070, partial [Candidatus Poseidoniaceae archaeon]|nr:hypothetical protein [Candidatus Poseidoniaceae archaeon]
MEPALGPDGSSISPLQTKRGCVVLRLETTFLCPAPVPQNTGAQMPEIVVLVKQVPDTNARIAIAGDAVDLSGVKMVMSPYDEFALEAALRHKEAVGGNVTALTMG